MAGRGSCDAARCGAALRALAVAIASLSVFVACSGADEGPGAGRGERPVLIVGWDGASFERIDPLLAEGRLPNLARLLARGASAELESTAVPISSAAWVGATTGKHPGKTGVYDFFEPVAGSYEVTLTSARSNRAAPIWRVLTERGRRSVVWGVPLTYPPEPILGTLVAGMLSPFDATYTWPPELTAELRAAGFEPDLGTWREDRDLTWGHALEQIDLKGRLVVERLENEDWDLAWVVFKSLDVVSHRAYGSGFADEVDPVYERLDRILGELVDAAGKDANVLVVSDHGFASYRGAFDLQRWLFGTGFSVEVSASTEDPSHAPDGPLATARARAHAARLATIDLERSRALAGTCEGNWGGIRLNVRGREPSGVVERAQVPALLADIEERLEAWGDDTGLIQRVLRGHQLYAGPEAERVVPDLLVEVAPHVQVVANGGALVLGTYEHALPDHTRAGILIAAGPAFARTEERGFASVFDVGPTALHLLGLPLDDAMTGRALVELLVDPRPALVVPQRDLAPATFEGASAVSRPFEPAEVEEIEGRLRALGYGD